MKMNEFQARARVMKALSSPVRLMIVDALRTEERCICELQPLFPHAKSTLSRHVAALRDAGIIRERREGVRMYLSLVTPCVLTMLDCTMAVTRSEAVRRPGGPSRRSDS